MGSPKKSWDGGELPVPDSSDLQPDARFLSGVRRNCSTVSLLHLWRVLRRRRRLVASVVGGLMLLCLLVCFLAPKQYEASARIVLRTSPATSLSLEAPEFSASTSTSVQQETLATVLRSEQLAWRVILDLKLYQEPGFIASTPELMGGFTGRFPDFLPKNPAANAQAFLLERFEGRLRVQILPRTLLVQIRFRSRDAELSAAVVNDLIRIYEQQESESRMEETAQASQWLEGQLRVLKKRMEEDQQRLTAFQVQHGILTTPQTLASGQLSESQNDSRLVEIDDLERQLAIATAERIRSETELRAASQTNPELVVASELDPQNEDAKLVERFRSAWQTAVEREQGLRKSLDERTGDALRRNQAATQYALMRQEANSRHDLYMQVQEKVEEAGLAVGLPTSNISVVDRALPPARPVAPDLPLDLTIAFFISLWLAVGSALLAESLHPSLAGSVTAGTVKLPMSDEVRPGSAARRPGRAAGCARP
jgi:uncharacterized protein involved in exopolysaccharide biosynthesis